MKIYNFHPLTTLEIQKLHLRCSTGLRMRLCSDLRTDISFIVSRISESPDIQGNWFNASIKLIKRRMIIELSLESKTFLKSEMQKTKIHFQN